MSRSSSDGSRAAAALLVLAFGLVAAAGPALAAGPVDVEDLLFDLQILPLDGAPPPPFTLEALDGTRWSLAALRGRPALLYFWESG